MKKQCVVLVADRNPHIRNFVQRELTIDGYRVFTAENAGQLKSWIIRTAKLDVLVMDPNMPGIESREQVRSLLSLRPALPVIIHCHSPDCSTLRGIAGKVAIVEKNGNSVDEVKEQISHLLASRLSLQKGTV